MYTILRMATSCIDQHTKSFKCLKNICMFRLTQLRVVALSLSYYLSYIHCAKIAEIIDKSAKATKAEIIIYIHCVLKLKWTTVTIRNYWSPNASTSFNIFKSTERSCSTTFGTMASLILKTASSYRRRKPLLRKLESLWTFWQGKDHRRISICWRACSWSILCCMRN